MRKPTICICKTEMQNRKAELATWTVQYLYFLKLNLEATIFCGCTARSVNVGFLIKSLNRAPRYSLILGVKQQLIPTRGMSGIDPKP